MVKRDDDQASASQRSSRGAARRGPLALLLTAFVALLVGALAVRGDDNAERIEEGERTVTPLAMGDGTNVIGDPTSGTSNQMWASINGPFTPYEYGDPFSTRCSGASTNDNSCSSPPNPEYRPDGYQYGVHVGDDTVGGTLLVELYDAGHYHRDNFPHTETADYSSPGSQAPGDLGVNTQFTLWAPDGEAAAQQATCTTGSARLLIEAETDADLYRNQWTTLCAIVVRESGTYRLQVQSSDISGLTDHGSGLNQYGVRATTDRGTQPSVFGIGDVSVFVSPEQGAAGAEHVLANVPETYAGDTLRIQLFDPGDGQSGSATMQILDPDGNVPPCAHRTLQAPSDVHLPRCAIEVRHETDIDGVAMTVADPMDAVSTTGGAPMPTVFTEFAPANDAPPATATSAANSPYNGQWLVIHIQLPEDYSCDVCLWSLRFDWTGTANDRATWTAHILAVEETTTTTAPATTGAEPTTVATTGTSTTDTTTPPTTEPHATSTTNQPPPTTGGDDDDDEDDDDDR